MLLAAAMLKEKVEELRALPLDNRAALGIQLAHVGTSMRVRSHPDCRCSEMQ